MLLPVAEGKGVALFVCPLIFLFFLFAAPFLSRSRDPEPVCACPNPPASNPRVGEDRKEGEGSRGLVGSVRRVVAEAGLYCGLP